MNEFIIEFVYGQMPFTALVIPKKAGGKLIYAVKLQSQNQELKLDISTVPCDDGKTEWCYSGGWDEGVDFDPDLLMEIGEAIEKYQIENP
jgi:hypothetical protein